MTYAEKYKFYYDKAELALDEAIEQTLITSGKSSVSDAAIYSLKGGGKRARAVLCIAVCDMLCGNLELAAKYAAAVEMLHCYTLIHDDLPCMDNDDYRRGRESCHKKYSEATALLAGDALLTACFEMLASADGSALQNLAAITKLSKCTGAKGTIYGQELDMYFENKEANEQQLLEIHTNKTGMLIEAAAILGVIAADDEFETEIKVVSEFAFEIGLVFQIIDDILNVTSNFEETGKSGGSDAQSGKTTFVKLFGVDGATEIAHKKTKEVCDKIYGVFDARADFLIELADTLLKRKN